MILIELDDEQQTVFDTAMGLGLYPSEKALLADGLTAAQARIDAWAEEMRRRDRECARIPADEVFDRLLSDLEELAQAQEGNADPALSGTR